jgi:hypothetical protein
MALRITTNRVPQTKKKKKFGLWIHQSQLKAMDETNNKYPHDLLMSNPHTKGRGRGKEKGNGKADKPLAATLANEHARCPSSLFPPIPSLPRCLHPYLWSNAAFFLILHTFLLHP